ncbi:hypothetical protein [Paraburkholderia sp. BR14320]|uniref:hypothetical protein n=1 Tax=unclassified Paraburkholderia TaxID=2615204 RepID=UPI0034CD477B
MRDERAQACTHDSAIPLFIGDWRMFQIDNSTAISAQPPSTPAGAAGFFTDGNPASNLAATIVPAERLNSVMMELVNAVTGAGQTLNKAAFNQLWTAMQTIAKNPGVTPPQFDNTTKTATTQFVQRALGNYQSGVVTFRRNDQYHFRTGGRILGYLFECDRNRATR